MDSFKFNPFLLYTVIVNKNKKNQTELVNMHVSR